MSRQLIILLLLNLLSPPPAAQADLIYLIDLDPIAIGVQDLLVLRPGEQLTVDIVMALTDSTTIDIYGVSVQFDTQELDFRLSDSFGLPPAGFEELAELDFAGSIIAGIRAATPITAIGSGPMGPQSFVIAKLHFVGLAPTGGLEDIDLFLFESPLDGSFDRLSQQLTPQFHGARIVVGVPEPSSWSLITMLGLVNIGTHRRRRRPVTREKTRT